jgi:2'-5' RNA ligase
MSKGRRLFFALVPDAKVRRQVEQVQHSLALSGRAAKPAQFHATLSFLGMQPAELMPEIQNIASGLSFRPCRVVMNRFGQFPRAGVAWLGADEIPQELLVFQEALVSALLAGGIGHDRKAWKFHITLYRKLRKQGPIMAPVEIVWPLNGFDLIESVNVGNGVKYNSIGHWKAEL